MTNRLRELLALYWCNEISKEEKAELEQLLLKHPDVWLKSGLMDQLSFSKQPVMDEDAAAEWADKVSREIEVTENMQAGTEQQETARKRPPFRTALLASIFLVAAAGLFLVYTWWMAAPGGYKVATTDAGMKTRIRLSDGTMVWLNAGSSLKYPPKFGKHTREVFLEGEAYFDVKQQVNQPFIIHTEKMDIKVLGTAFNVRSYEDEDFQETSLISGAVEISVKQADKLSRVVLKPNQKLVVHDIKHTQTKVEKATIIHQSADVIIERKALSAILSPDSGQVAETAWLSNRFVFQNETLESMARRLERWYGITIVIKDPQLSGLRFTGRADNLPLEKLLAILQEIKPFNYSIEDGTVIIN
jgi:transmembrane sensor